MKYYTLHEPISNERADHASRWLRPPKRAMVIFYHVVYVWLIFPSLRRPEACSRRSVVALTFAYCTQTPRTSRSQSSLCLLGVAFVRSVTSFEFEVTLKNGLCQTFEWHKQVYMRLPQPAHARASETPLLIPIYPTCPLSMQFNFHISMFICSKNLLSVVSTIAMIFIVSKRVVIWVSMWICSTNRDYCNRWIY